MTGERVKTKNELLELAKFVDTARRVASGDGDSLTVAMMNRQTEILEWAAGVNSKGAGCVQEFVDFARPISNLNPENAFTPEPETATLINRSEEDFAKALEASDKGYEDLLKNGGDIHSILTAGTIKGVLDWMAGRDNKQAAIIDAFVNGRSKEHHEQNVKENPLSTFLAKVALAGNL